MISSLANEIVTILGVDSAVYPETWTVLIGVFAQILLLALLCVPVFFVYNFVKFILEA